MSKMVVVKQNDEKDCGACSLQSVVRYYKGYVSLEKIREDTCTSFSGTSVYHLVKAANNYGFDALAKKILDKKIDNVILPAIVHVCFENGINHFMVLYEIEHDNYIFMDPGKGKIKMCKNDFNKIFTGVFIELYPKQNIIHQNKSNSLLNLFADLIKHNKKIIIKVVLVTIIFTIITLIVSLYFKVRYQYLYSLNRQKEFILIYVFFVLVLLKVLFNYYKNYLINIFNKNIDSELLNNFIRHIFLLPSKFIETRTTGDIMTRVNDIWEIKNFIVNIFVENLFNVFLIINSLIILFFIHVKLTVVLGLGVILYLLFSIILSPYIYRRIQNNVDFETEFNSSLVENINMLQSIKNLNIIDYSFNKVKNSFSKLINDNYEFTNIYNNYESIKNMILELLIFIIYTLGFYYVSKGNISFTELLVFDALLFYFLEPLKNILLLLPQYNFLRAKYNKMCDFIDVEEEDLNNVEEFKNGDIIINNISYSYDGYHNLFSNYNLSIKKGEKIMIKGESGNGKSTLCKMLNRTITPNSGIIQINGKNISDYSLSTIRENITYIGQKEHLYTDSIKNNVMMNNKNQILFEKICKICYIDKIISNKQMMFNYGVNNDSNNLSGGEKQRLIVARGLMNNSPIIILDEALSETDYYLERNIIANIKKFFPEKTLIYISHKHQDSMFDRVINI